MKFRHIPQYLDTPVSTEHFQQKLSAGSYKACEILRALLTFTAIGSLGGDPINNLSLNELQSQLGQINQALNTGQPDCIVWAIRWAWPVLEQSLIVFEAFEVLRAVEGLCDLITNQPQEQISRNLLAYLQNNHEGAFEYAILGENFKALNLSENLLERILETSIYKNDVLKGFIGF
jgi:hypothetical protein